MSLPPPSVMVESITAMMDQLPILATQLGYRGASHELGASTPEETALADALFKVSETWTASRPPIAPAAPRHEVDTCPERGDPCPADCTFRSDCEAVRPS